MFQPAFDAYAYHERKAREATNQKNFDSHAYHERMALEEAKKKAAENAQQPSGATISGLSP